MAPAQQKSASWLLQQRQRLAKLNNIWRRNTISFASKFKLQLWETGPCLLIPRRKRKEKNKKQRKRSRLFEMKCLWKVLHILYLKQDQWLDEQQDQFPCGSRGTSSCDCRETETRMIWACHAQRQPLQIPPSGHLGGSAGEILDGQLQSMGVPAYTSLTELLMTASYRKGSSTLFNIFLERSWQTL